MSERHPLGYNEFDIEEARNAGKSFGIKQEKERIIKLLEDFDDSKLWRQISFQPDAYEGFDVSDIIELIKGEQE